MSAEGAIIYHAPRSNAMVLQLCAVGFIGMGLWLVLSSDSEDGAAVVARVAGIASILCFGLSTVLIGRQVVAREATYAVTHDGFYLGAPGEEDVLFVDWREVQGVGIANIGDEKVMTFAFRDPNIVKKRMSGEQRAKAEQNEEAGVPILSIPQNRLDTPVEDVRNVSTRFFFAAS